MTEGRTDPNATGRTPRRARHASPWARAAAVAVVAVVLVLLAWFVRQASRPATSGERFRYDVSDLRRVDPRLKIGRELPPLAVDIANPHALAVDRSNRLYVGGDSAIAIMDPDGRPVRKIPADRRISCLAVGGDGSIYAGQGNAIVVFGPDGERRAEWAQLGTNTVLTSLAVNEKDLFAADAGQRTVWRFDLNGTLLGRIGARENKDGGFPGFFIPSPYFDLAFGPEGALWVVDPGRHKFIRFSPDGAVLSSWERTGMDIDGFSGCCNPSHIAIRADGSFVTSEKGLVRIKVHAVTGSLLGVLAGPDRFGPDTRGLDLAVDGRGRILALDPDQAVILVFVVEDA